MTFAEEASDTLRDLEEVLRRPTFVYRGRTLPCVPSMLLRGTVLQTGGKQEEVSLTLVVRKDHSLFITADNAIQTVDQESPLRPETLADSDTPPPSPEKIVSYEQREYRVASRDEDAASVAWKLHLTSPTRRSRS